MCSSVRSSGQSFIWGCVFVVSLLAATPAAAAPAAEEPPPSETQKEFKSIEWTQGPAKVGIGDHAELEVPDGFAYTGSTGARKLLELMHNPTDGSELGILTDRNLEMFVLFEFQDIGYVKDADKEKLDGDEILDSIRKATRRRTRRARSAAGRRSRSSAGTRRPFYNAETNNLEWCIKGESQGRAIVNYNTRILGRSGVMSANLMVSPEQAGPTRCRR